VVASLDSVNRRPASISARCTISVSGKIPNGGPVGHVELERDGAVIMLGFAGSRLGETSSITLVFVDDANAASGRVPDTGGPVLEEPIDQPRGLRQAVVGDPEGQRSELTQHLHDAAPADWGAEQLGPLPG